MDKDNQNTELDNTDKKLHISGVMNSILNDLQEQIKYYEEPPRMHISNEYYDRCKYRVEGLFDAIEIVKKYCS